MHYKDGTEAKVGDLVKFPFSKHAADGTATPGTRIGKLVRAQPGGTTCNGTVADVRFALPEGSQPWESPCMDIWQSSVTIGDCELFHRPE
jgi:hypothetical protein